MRKERLERTNEYIVTHWKNTVRSWEAGGALVELPFPVSVPCETQMFTFFFYWDTYFINCGLIFDDPAQALNNLRNMKFLVERFGFIPNANAKGMLNRSQPPLYASAVKDYYDRFPSVSVVEEFYPTLKSEYEFWISRRSTSCGLARYASEPSEEEISEMYGVLSSRGILEPDVPDMRLRTLHLLAEAESGWDFTPRFLGRALDFAPADLNSILFANERILSEFADILGRVEDSAAFARAAETRKSRMDALLRDSEGVYRDFDFVRGELSPVVSAASLLPYWAGESADRGACERTLAALECENGLAACGKYPSGKIFQWDYPNMWPCLVGFAVRGLERAGAADAAARVAEKYLTAVSETFAEEGFLCEKYSALTGRCSTHNEYEPPKMLGWTAGVFRELYERYAK